MPQLTTDLQQSKESLAAQSQQNLVSHHHHNPLYFYLVQSDPQHVGAQAPRLRVQPGVGPEPEAAPRGEALLLRGQRDTDAPRPEGQQAEQRGGRHRGDQRVKEKGGEKDGS